MAPGLAAGRATLGSAIRDTNRNVVSAFVESPTFGGSSWLAHISLMSGVEVRDPDTNARLMTETRPTLVSEFAAHGYSTTALMPGLRQRVARGFVLRVSRDLRCDATGLRGPEFGWFAIPDQFTLAKFDALTGDRRHGRRCSCSIRPSARIFRSARRRRISLTGAGCSTRTRSTGRRSCARTPGNRTGPISRPDTSTRCLTPTTPSVDYLRRHAGRDFVMVLLGDHQPAAVVSGERRVVGRPGARHRVAAGRCSTGSSARGFRQGLVPARPSLAHMNALLPILLDSFGDR